MHPGSQTANFRVSTIPAAQGEETLIRILAVTRKKTILTMEKTIIPQTILQPLKCLTQNPNRIIFVNEPTGSGKTTTLHAAIHEITRAASLFAPSRIRSKSSSPA
jgi:type II secretory ATPase GspE/PulE/Tfp pilus assembly ATPase PilB-like protein